MVSTISSIKRINIKMTKGQNDNTKTNRLKTMTKDKGLNKKLSKTKIIKTKFHF